MVAASWCSAAATEEGRDCDKYCSSCTSACHNDTAVHQDTGGR